MYVKVERWHRDMVWRQKFDFLDTTIRHDLAEEDKEAKAKEAMNSAAIADGTVDGARPQTADTAGGGVGTLGASAGAAGSTLARGGTGTLSLPNLSGSEQQRPATVPTNVGGGRRPQSRQGKKLGKQVQSSVSLRPASGREGLMLQGALALPLEWSRGYYEDDEVLVSEDILHCTNPKLFPLRPYHKDPTSLIRYDPLEDLSSAPLPDGFGNRGRDHQ